MKKPMSQTQVGLILMMVLLGAFVALAIFSGVMAFSQLPTLHGVRVV